MKLIFTALLSLIVSVGIAQNVAVKKCANEIVTENLGKKIPGYKEGIEELDNSVREYIQKHKEMYANAKAVGTSPTVYYIPVVVNVIHTGGAIGTIYNPTDAAINAMITALNDVYSNNFDEPSVAGTFNSVDIPIRFQLAQRSPSCATTTGINRYDYSSNATYVADGVSSDLGVTPGIDDALVKALINWPANDYYNIWIVNKIDAMDGTSGSFVAGYATLPSTYISNQDGTIILATQICPTCTTMPHELGHAFSLRHPFQGGSASTCPSNTNCNTDNDQVCDTDPEMTDFDCNPVGTNSCTGTSWASSTIQYNIMGYHGCTDRFTPGQSTKAVTSLLAPRLGLATSLGVDPPPAVAVKPATCNPTNLNPTNGFAFGPRSVLFNEIQYNSVYYTNNAFYANVGGAVLDDRSCNHQTTLYKSVSSYNLSVVTGTNAQIVKAYIDYNNDGSFDPITELVMNSTGAAGTYTHTTTVAIPASGVTVDTFIRMRVLADFTGSPSYSSCSALEYGQAEDFAVMIKNAPLPLTWKNVYAILNTTNTVDINWSTYQEINCSYFEVEHSINGVDFVKINSTEAKGNSNAVNYYKHQHSSPVIGKNCYRIKQYDLNGKYSYSKVVSVDISKASNIVLTAIPNPAQNEINIELANTSSKNNIEVVVIDITGKEVLKGISAYTNNTHKTKFDISSLPKGMYMVYVTTSGQKLYSKFIKE